MVYAARWLLTTDDASAFVGAVFVDVAVCTAATADDAATLLPNNNAWLAFDGKLLLMLLLVIWPSEVSSIFSIGCVMGNVLKSF